MTTKITTTPSPLEVVDKINVLVDESSTNATNITSAKNASITGLSVSGKVITYTKGNGTTGTITTQDTNTTYSAMTASEATTGTATTARSITAKVLHDKIKETVTSSAGLPVGHMYWSVEPNVPAGRLPALGSTYNRSLYADLWAWANSVGLVKTEAQWQAIASANDGNCAYYSSGDGSSTFRVPSIKGWVKGANSVDEVGSYLEAGLPNLTGWITLGQNNGHNPKADGKLFTLTESSNDGAASWAANHSFDATFNASKYNAIYGNADTVQPSSLVGVWVIVAYGTVTNIGEADVADVMQAVEQVQANIGSVNNRIETLSFMPDYSAGVTKTNNTTYTAERDGYLKWGASIANGGTSYITINGTEFARMTAGSPTGLQPVQGLLIPIPKGTTYTGTNTNMLIFYPMKAV